MDLEANSDYTRGNSHRDSLDSEGSVHSADDTWGTQPEYQPSASPPPQRNQVEPNRIPRESGLARQDAITHPSQPRQQKTRPGCCMPAWLIILLSLLAVAGIVAAIFFFFCAKSTEQKILDLAQKVKNEDLTQAQMKKAVAEGTRLLVKLAKKPKRAQKFMQEHGAELQALYAGLPAGIAPQINVGDMSTPPTQYAATSTEQKILDLAQNVKNEGLTDAKYTKGMKLFAKLKKNPKRAQKFEQQHAAELEAIYRSTLSAGTVPHQNVGDMSTPSAQHAGTGSTEQKILDLAQKVKNGNLTQAEKDNAYSEGTRLLEKLAKNPKRAQKFGQEHAAELLAIRAKLLGSA